MGHKYHLQGLIDLCSDHLSVRITKENFVEIGNLAELLDLEDLLEKCMHFIIEEEFGMEDLDGLAPTILRKLFVTSQSSRFNPKSFGDKNCRGIFFHRRILGCSTARQTSIFRLCFEASPGLKLSGAGIYIGKYSGTAYYEVY